MKSGDPPYFWAGFELDGEPCSLFTDSAINVLIQEQQ